MEQYKRRCGDRKDGRLLRELDSLHFITGIIYPNRCDNEAYISVKVDLTAMNAYLARKNEEEKDFPYTMFHIVVAALEKTITLRPKLNRFIVNSNFYQRNEVSAAFVVKKQFSDKGAEALAVLHAVLDFRRAIDVPGYDRIPLAEETRFIATMNYGYAGTRELNEALTSRFAVVQMPTITQDNLEKLLRAQFPDLAAKYVHQFALLFLDLQKKCDSAEISTKALDLRGMLDALRLIRRGIPAGAALDMGITNKAFDSYEQGLIRDVIAARIPAKLDAGKLFA